MIVIILFSFSSFVVAVIVDPATAAGTGLKPLDVVIVLQLRARLGRLLALLSTESTYDSTSVVIYPRYPISNPAFYTSPSFSLLSMVTTPIERMRSRIHQRVGLQCAHHLRANVPHGSWPVCTTSRRISRTDRVWQKRQIAMVRKSPIVHVLALMELRHRCL